MCGNTHFKVARNFDTEETPYTTPRPKWDGTRSPEKHARPRDLTCEVIANTSLSIATQARAGQPYRSPPKPNHGQPQGGPREQGCGYSKPYGSSGQQGNPATGYYGYNGARFTEPNPVTHYGAAAVSNVRRNLLPADTAQSRLTSALSSGTPPMGHTAGYNGARFTELNPVTHYGATAVRNVRRNLLPADTAQSRLTSAHSSGTPPMGHAAGYNGARFTEPNPVTHYGATAVRNVRRNLLPADTAQSRLTSAHSSGTPPRGTPQSGFTQGHAQQKPDILGRVGHTPLTSRSPKNWAYAHRESSASSSPARNQPARGTRLASQRSPGDMGRQVRRKIPTPPPSDRDSHSPHSFPPSPLAASGQGDIAGLSDRDVALRNAATEAKRQREAQASGDISLSQIEIDAAKLERVIDDLTVELGCKYCQHALKMSDADFNTLPVEQVLQNMRNLAPKIHLKRFHGARAAFKAIRAWLVAHKFEHHTTNIPSGIMIMYFAEAQAKGRARLREKGAAGNEGDNDIPVWEASGASPREEPKKYTGKSSGNFHRKGVALLNSHYAFQWDLQSVSSQIQVDGASDLPETAQVKSLKMVSELEEFCDNEEHSIFERSFAAATLFGTWACMRLQQAQKVCIQGIRLAASGNPLDSIVEGFVILDKGRKRRDMRPRPFWMPLWYHGLTGVV